MAYFTPTVLPMIAVANIWLFFYTPQYGLLEKFTSLLGMPSVNWLGNPHTALGAVTVVAIWKEAGFFMIFYPAALQTLNPSLREAAAIEGASRWQFFRRVQWPLLMPTTLFVLINAFINAFRMVDHLFVLTRVAGPTTPPSLLLYHLYEVGFSFWTRPTPRPSPWCCWWCWRASRSSSSSCSTGGCTTNEAAMHPGQQGGSAMNSAAQHLAFNEPSWLDTLAAWVLALLWILPLAYAVWTAFHPAAYATRFDLLAPLSSTTSAAPGRRRRSRATSSTPCCWCDDPGGAAVLSTLAAYAFARYRFPAATSPSRWCWCSCSSCRTSCWSRTTRP